MALARLKRMRRRARDRLRRHRHLYRLVRIVKYGPFSGFTQEAPRRALLRRGRVAAWRLLYLGSGGRRQPGMVNLDITDVTGPDVVGDGYRLPFADATFDAVLCEYVIEHVPDPEGFLLAASRVLKPDGYWYLHVPFLQPVHADGIDFLRWTRPGFEQALARVGLEVVESGSHTGPAMALFWLLKDTLALLLSLGWRPLYRAIRYLLAWLLTPLLLLDLLLLRLPAGADLACGYYVVARRKTAGPCGP